MNVYHFIFTDTAHELLIYRKTLFIAKAVVNSDKVHSVPLKPGSQKFLISTVYIQRAKLWEDFDADKPCRGAYVAWNLKERKKINRYPVTPASNPVQTEFTNVKESDRGRKRKRNEQNWEEKRKKHSRDSGLSYSP